MRHEAADIKADIKILVMLLCNYYYGGLDDVRCQLIDNMHIRKKMTSNHNSRIPFPAITLPTKMHIKHPATPAIRIPCHALPNSHYRSKPAFLENPSSSIRLLVQAFGDLSRCRPKNVELASLYTYSPPMYLASFANAVGFLRRVYRCSSR